MGLLVDVNLGLPLFSGLAFAGFAVGVIVVNNKV